MSWRTPRSLSRFCRDVLPLMARQADGKQALQVIADVVETDRWNSFDRFHDTTDTMVRYYEEVGAKTEVHPIQTGGRLGSGRWIIHEATDVRGATLDVVRPVRQRVLDYKDNPWHVVQWSGSTPRGGMRCELVIIDSEQELERVPASGLTGKIVLTRLNIRSLVETLASKGAVGIITDIPVAQLPNATAWTKFGWGGIPLGNAAINMVGLVLSEREGKKLRRLARQHGRLEVHAEVDVQRYVGTHDMVSGLIPGGEDPQDELWVLAHSAEPGALDNASGVALCVEIARVLEALIKAGTLPRPKRTIRLLNAYECYGFFKYLEDVRHLQNPLAGVVIDTVGSKPALCNGRLEWHATIPMSAGFVDRVGEAIIRSALKLQNPGYKLHLESFMSTADTLIGDPKYGFPAPWITTHHRDGNKASIIYHTSADTLDRVSVRGMQVCAVAMAGYLYYLANAGTKEAVELARAETGHALGQLQRGKRHSRTELNYLQEAHQCSLTQLKRLLWEGGHREALAHFVEGEREVREAVGKKQRKESRKRRVPGAGRIPRRTAVLSPDGTNLAPEMNRRIGAAGLASWALFWADGKRTLEQIAELLSCEHGRQVDVEKVAAFFEAHADLGYVDLIDADDVVTQGQMVADLKKLGVEAGMDLMVHSSLSRIGHVSGGAEMVVEALLAAVGRKGTLMFPSFNHGGARVFNRLATPTSNGAIADAAWRRPDAARSLHPSHALTAIGPRAEAFCQGHLEAGIWAQDSPIGRLVHAGGFILSLGVTHDSSTAYHIAEESVPCGCIDPFGNVDRAVMADGSVQEVQGLAWRDGSCPVPPAKLDETLDRRKMQRRGKVGAADCALVLALDLWKVRREHLKKVCPTCKIKPGYRK